MGTPAQTIMTPAAAGPAEPVPVAILARTSTLQLQNPRPIVASITRQRDWLAFSHSGPRPLWGLIHDDGI